MYSTQPTITKASEHVSPFRMPSRATFSANPAKRSRPTTVVAKQKRKRQLAPTKVSMGRQVFPKQLQATLKYSDWIIVTAATFNSVIYHANGMYDPQYAAGGHQPMYFDQIMTLYNHFTVTSSKITYRIVSAEYNNPSWAAAYVDDDATLSASLYSAWAERPGAKTVAWSSATQQEKVLTQSWNLKSTFGADPLSDPTLSGTASADPSELSFFVLGLQTAALGGTQDYSIFITIEYNAIFHELKTIAQS